MRRIALLVVFGCAFGYADESVDQLDACKLAQVQLAAENAKLQTRLLELEQKAKQEELRAKYKLGPGDEVDPKSLKIIRHKVAEKPKK